MSPRRLPMPSSVVAGLALGASVALVLAGNRHLPLVRLSSLKLEAGLPSRFLWTVDTGRQVCRLGDRGVSASRRDEGAEAPADGVYRTLPPGRAGGGLPTYVVLCRDRGARLFVPVEDVPDWTVPLLQRRLNEDWPEHPRSRWVQFHVDRIYRGLHLEIDLSRPPRDGLPPRDDRDELIFLAKDETFVTDRFLVPRPISRSRFLRGDLDLPRTRSEPADCAMARAVAAPETLLLFDPAGGSMRRLVLPVSLLEPVRRARAGALPVPAIQALRGWIAEDCDGSRGVGTAELSASLREDLGRDIGQFMDVFQEAVRDHATIHGYPSSFVDQIVSRRGTLSRLGIEPGGGA